MICDFSYCFPEQTNCYSSDSTDWSKPTLIISPAARCRAVRHPGLGAAASFGSSLMSCQASYFLSLRLFPKAATICVCVCVRAHVYRDTCVCLCPANEQTQGNEERQPSVLTLRMSLLKPRSQVPRIASRTLWVGGGEVSEEA